MDNQLLARILSRLVKFRDEIVKEDMIVPPWVVDSIEEIESAQQGVNSDGAYRLPDSIIEALNSGDGVYRP